MPAPLHLLVGPALISVFLAGFPVSFFACADQQHAFGAVRAPGHVVGIPLVRPVAGAGGFAGGADTGEQHRISGVRPVLVADHAAGVVGATAAADRDDQAVDHRRGVGTAAVAAQDAGDVKAGRAPTIGAVSGAGLGLLGGLDLSQGDGGGVLLGLAHGRLLAALLRRCCDRESNQALGLSTAIMGHDALMPNAQITGPGEQTQGEQK